MKLSKSRLRQIIGEELNEIGVPFLDTGLGVPGGTRGGADPHTAALDAVEDYILENYGADTKLIDLMQKAQEAVADFENPLQDDDDEYEE